MRATVVGAGAWGTALADLLARNGETVTLWAYEPDVVKSINSSRENRRFLADATLHEGVRATGDLEAAVRGVDLVVFVTPSHVLRGIAKRAAGAVDDRATLVVASKGIERETLALMTDVVSQEVPRRPVVGLSGPSFAREVVQRQPTAVVAASHSRQAAEQVQTALSSDAFRVYTHADVVGVELGGSLKNVMAIATGMAEGLGLGYNPRAALITRGLAEMTRLGVALGADPLTFAGLAGIGDLVLTCTGALSRNRQLGMDIGQGNRLEDLLAARETVAEGVYTTQSARALASREEIDMPIVAAVYRILFEGSDPRAAIGELMTRELRPERD
ncbi:MAG TPA: NAD(P)H-dependent glycerol-3-phosphate dehydrogenase [Gemmatimonadaceae bacterium]|nr:NAD(P)H-dependent glycerol-3-phosphate dehydrogenase [Gemmatimonadaceae bacterium]